MEHSHPGYRNAYNLYRQIWTDDFPAYLTTGRESFSTEMSFFLTVAAIEYSISSKTSLGWRLENRGGIRNTIRRRTRQCRAGVTGIQGAEITGECKTIGKFSRCPKAVSGLEKSELGIGKKLL